MILFWRITTRLSISMRLIFFCGLFRFCHFYGTKHVHAKIKNDCETAQCLLHALLLQCRLILLDRIKRLRSPLEIQ